jgi:hypothetical protein
MSLSKQDLEGSFERLKHSQFGGMVFYGEERGYVRSAFTK